MDPSPHEYSSQGQKEVSYSNQPSTPTEKQSFGVPQPVDQPYQSSRYIQPDQTIRKYKIVITPHNDLPSRYHSGHQEYQPYSGRYIPEEVSDYIVQDRLGNILLNNYLNRMYGLGKCLCIIAILKLLKYGNQAVSAFMDMDKYTAFSSIVRICILILFIQGYMKLDVNKVKCYYIFKRIEYVLGIIALVIVLAVIYITQGQNVELIGQAIELIGEVAFNV